MNETLSEEALQEVGSGGSETPEKERSSPEYVSVETFQQGLERIASDIKEQFKALKQSSRDTIDHRVTGMESKLLEKVKGMLPEGTDFTALEREAWIETQMAGDQEPSKAPASGSPQAPGQPQASGGNLVVQEITAILQAHGVSADHPEIRAYVRENEGQPWYKVGSGLEELAEQIGSRTGDPANIMGTGSGGSAPSPNLKANYLKEVNELRAKGGLSGRTTDLREIQEKYFGMGLTDVLQIDLAKELRL